MYKFLTYSPFSLTVSMRLENRVGSHVSALVAQLWRGLLLSSSGWLAESSVESAGKTCFRASNRP